MARPVSKRKIKYFPENYRFIPENACPEHLDDVVLTHDELEAVRLCDIANMEQSHAADSMGVSRGTYQRIISSARNKIASALVFGQSISIKGGNYYLDDCIAQCKSCGHTWNNPCDVLFRDDNGLCPSCGSGSITCTGKNGLCSLGKRRHEDMLSKQTRQEIRK